MVLKKASLPSPAGFQPPSGPRIPWSRSWFFENLAYSPNFISQENKDAFSSLMPLWDFSLVNFFKQRKENMNLRINTFALPLNSLVGWQ